jgi:hypothetical protein
MELHTDDIIHIRATATNVVSAADGTHLVYVGNVPLHVKPEDITGIEARRYRPGDRVICYVAGNAVTPIPGKVLCMHGHEVWVEHENGRCLVHPASSVRPHVKAAAQQ